MLIEIHHSNYCTTVITVIVVIVIFKHHHCHITDYITCVIKLNELQCMLCTVCCY